MFGKDKNYESEALTRFFAQNKRGKKIRILNTPSSIAGVGTHVGIAGITNLRTVVLEYTNKASL